MTSGATTSATTATGGSPATVAAGPGLSGPAGGAWSLVDGGAHGSSHYCRECETFHQTAWCYYVGAVARITLCEECVEGIIKVVK
jgi:hypothetical protein